jgi:hypothetical protein
MACFSFSIISGLLFSTGNAAIEMMVPGAELLNVDFDEINAGRDLYLFNQIENYGSRIEGTFFDGAAKRLFGDERINLFVDDNTYGLVTEDGLVKSFHIGGLDDVSMNMFSDQETIGWILNVDDKLGAFELALGNDDITYEAVGFGNKIKFGTAFFFMNVGRLLGFIDEPEVCTQIELNVPEDFSDIWSALNHASSLDCDSVKVYVAEGIYYDGQLDIQMETELIGSSAVLAHGYIVNEGFDLIIDGLSLREGYGIDVSGGSLVLRNLEVFGSDGVGVNVENGDLEMNNVVVSLAEESTVINHGLNSGVGVYLLNSDAVMRDVSLTHNLGGALRIDDSRVYATDLSVRQNSVNIIGENDLLGVVEIKNSGLLLMESSTFSANDYLGLLVMDDGKAHLRNVELSGTGEINGNAGHNILVKQHSASEGMAMLELSDFRIAHAERTGMYVSDGLVWLENGWIEHNGNGVVLMAEENLTVVDPDCLSNEVYIANNDVDVFVSNLNLPDSGLLGRLDAETGEFEEIVEEERDIICGRVNWDCDWC